jgi:hypothetical protein
MPIGIPDGQGRDSGIPPATEQAHSGQATNVNNEPAKATREFALSSIRLILQSRLVNAKAIHRRKESLNLNWDLPAIG